MKLETAAELVRLARESIASEFDGKQPVLPCREELQEKRGVFVTLLTWPSRELRGCIGFPLPVLPLVQAVVEAARHAAFNDPRFMPLSKEELDKIVIELSVLTVPRETKNVMQELVIGKHGIICEWNGFSGLLLPQVAVEHNMSKEEFISAVCEKAGLLRDAWKNHDVKFSLFEAEIFAEKEPNGEVVKVTLGKTA